MKKILLIFLSVLCVANINAKRNQPAEVPSIQIGSVEFKVVHFNTNKHQINQNGGMIEVINKKTNQVVDTIIVYKTKYNMFLERDVQDVFITSMTKDANVLIIIDEKNRKFKVNIAKYIKYSN